jgi:hypothetical protein
MEDIGAILYRTIDTAVGRWILRSTPKWKIAGDAEIEIRVAAFGGCKALIFSCLELTI